MMEVSRAEWLIVNDHCGVGVKNEAVPKISLVGRAIDASLLTFWRKFALRDGRIDRVTCLVACT